MDYNNLQRVQIVKIGEEFTWEIDELVAGQVPEK